MAKIRWKRAPLLPEERAVRRGMIGQLFEWLAFGAIPCWILIFSASVTLCALLPDGVRRMGLPLDTFFLIKFVVGGVGNVGNATAFSKVWGKRALMDRVFRLDIRKRFPQTGIVHIPFPFSPRPLLGAWRVDPHGKTIPEGLRRNGLPPGSGIPGFDGAGYSYRAGSSSPTRLPVGQPRHSPSGRPLRT